MFWNKDKKEKESVSKPKLVYSCDKVCINVPDAYVTHEQLHHKHFLNGDNAHRLSVIHDEFLKGFQFVANYPKSVTFFGSARFSEDHEYYVKARELARKIVEETGYAIVTGGGPGIMEAGNRGAKDADKGDKSIGINIELPFEQILNPYTTSNASFNYFFSRKVTMAFSAEAYIFFPGGFGTLDELFEMLTLVQTKKIQKTPIILFGNEFWGNLEIFLNENLLSDKYQTISPEDMDLFEITEDMDKICKIVKEAPLRDE